MNKLLKHAGAAAWKGKDLSGRTDWILKLTSIHCQELERAATAVLDRDITQLSRCDLPLPTLDPILDAVRDEVVDGRGFKLIRGVPVDSWPRAITARAYWAIGLRLGHPVVQNPAGHVLGHVKDIGGDADNPTQRGYQSAADLPFHTDIGAEVVGLLCLKPAKSGGVSSIVSAAAIWNEILNQRPDLADVLSAPFFRDRRGEEVKGQKPWYEMPIFMPAGDRMTTAYVRRFIMSCQRHTDVPRLSSKQIEAMNLLDEIAYSPEFKLEMDFQPGDIQFVNNIITLHTRTEYQDWPNELDKRHLYRLWLSIPNGWPLPKPLYARYGVDSSTGRPQGINLPQGIMPNAPLDAGALIGG